MFLIALIAAPIIISDCHSFKIPNIYLKILGISGLPTFLFFGFGQVSNLVLTLFFLALLIVVGVGMGDVKLIGLLALILNVQQPFQLFDYAHLLFLAASFYLVIVSLLKRRIPQQIALAPSIFMAMACYLATR